MSQKYDHWSAMHKFFHWTVAPLVILQLVLGFWRMGIENDAFRDTLMAWHINVGFTILWLMPLRLAWRLIHPVPRLPDTLRPFEKTLARANHYAFYVLLLMQPMIGWLVANSGGYGARLYGLLELPRLIGEDDGIKDTLEPLHLGIAMAIAALIIVHVAAAIRHHFILRDNTLRRMLMSG